MPVFLGLKAIDLAVIVGYFAVVMAIGFIASRKVKTESDFLLGGRKFGKGLLVMHWLCTGTHSEQPVQVSGATARVGLGGIWYQWMYMFSTPFYWMIAPITRRMRVTTTGDFFRLRFGKSTEILYSLVAISYFILSVAMLLRGAGSAIAGATLGEVPTQSVVLIMAGMFSLYIVAGGLVAAAYTDFLQGLLIIVLSFMLIPAGLSQIGGIATLHEKLPEAMFSITAPADSKEGNPIWVLAMSILGLVGIVAQPHVMTATGSGKTELSARVGMCYGNFIKRFLTMGWAFVGLIALVYFSDLFSDIPAGESIPNERYEELFGRAIHSFLGDGWRGLMIACLIAGLTSAETMMVGGAAIFSRNFYPYIHQGSSAAQRLLVGRIASAVVLILSACFAFWATSVTSLLTASIKVIGLLGPAVWAGIVWRRANAQGVWGSFLAGVAVWCLTEADPKSVEDGSPVIHWCVTQVDALSVWLHLDGLAGPQKILFTLAAGFAGMVLVSLFTRATPREMSDTFYARLYTPVGQEGLVALTRGTEKSIQNAQTGEDQPQYADDTPLDYKLASERWGYRFTRSLGLELPRMTFLDWAGFIFAWIVVGLIIALFAFLAGVGAR